MNIKSINEINEIIADISKVRDPSSLSDEIERLATTPTRSYFLSRHRHCFLRPFFFEKRQTVLDASYSGGAVARYFGELCFDVKTLELNSTTARLARERCRDLHNVEVTIEPFLNFKEQTKFDCVVILEHSENPLFPVENNSILTVILDKAHSLLAPSGKLLIAFFTPTKPKADALKATDTASHPSLKNRITQYQSIFESPGFLPPQIYECYPDHILPHTILRRDQSDDCPIDLESLTHTDVSWQDPHLPPSEMSFPEQKDNVTDFPARSVLLVASLSANPLTLSQIFAWHFTTDGRKKQFCTETRFQHTDGNGIYVVKRRLVSNHTLPPSDLEFLSINHQASKEAYVYGPSLAKELLRKTFKATSQTEFAALFIPWLTFLMESSIAESSTRPQTIEELELPADFIDATPFNIIATSEGNVIIDKEWISESTIPFGWVMLRGILNTCISGKSDNLQLVEPFQIFSIIASMLSLDFNRQSWTTWKQLEGLFHDAIFVNAEKIPNTIQLKSPKSPEPEDKILEKQLIEARKQLIEVNARLSDALAWLKRRDMEINKLTEHISLTDQALKKTERLAVKRLEENIKIDISLRKTNSALNETKTLALEQQKRNEELQLAEATLNRALETTKKLAISRLKEKNAQIDYNSILHSALEETKDLAIARLQEIESLKKKIDSNPFNIIKRKFSFHSRPEKHNER